MQKNTSLRRLMTAAVVTSVSLGLLYRLLRIAYSVVYADVTFADSFVAFMYYACAVNEGILWGAAVCSTAYFSQRCETARQGALCHIPVAAGFLTSYGVGLIYDIATVSVKGIELLAVANTVFRTASGVLLGFIAFLLARRRAKKGAASPASLIMPASAVVLAASLISRTAELTEDLIANSFSITGAEILSLVGEYLEIILLLGVLVFAAARLFWELFSRFDVKKHVSGGDE